MADFVFNIAKGAVAEKVRDGASNIEVMLLKTAEADTTFKDRDTVADITANGGVKCDFTNYAAKTGITGTITVDDTNDRVDVDIPDQTWLAAGGATNNNITDLLVCYRESAGDSGLIPLTCHDFTVTTDGSDLTAQINAVGFFRAT